MKYKRIVNTLMIFLILSILSGSPLNLLARASTGVILINTTTPPSIGQRVSAGGNVNLYFGLITWSGAQFYLLLSTNGFSDASGTQYSPTFTVNDLAQANVQTYTNANGTWHVGMNWINGSTPLNVAGGNYFIKAYDGSSASIAVTGTFITLTGLLQVTPASGPAGANLSINGYGFGANSFVNLSYYRTTSPFDKVPLANFVQANISGQFTHAIPAPDTKQILTAGDQAPALTTITFNAKSSSEETNATYNEYARGLKQIHTSIATGLWGNATEMSNVTRQVGQTIQIVGHYFSPGSASVLWDGLINIGTATVNSTGAFDTTVAIPATSGVPHWIVVQDANNVNFYVRVYVIHVSDSYEPDNSLSQFSTLSVTTSLQSQSRTIFPLGDNDYIRFYADPGTYIFYTNGSINTDAFLYDQNGTQLAYNNDNQGILQFRINYTISSSGYYFLRVRDSTSSTEGPYTLYFQSWDTFPPVTIHDYDLSWHTSDFTIHLNAIDSGSGVAATHYRINSGPIRTTTANGQPYINTEGANNTLEYWSLDVIGNEELPHKMLIEIKLDKTTPAGSIQINQGATYANVTKVTLTLLATDAISGVSQMRFSNEDSIWSDWEPYATSKAWNLTTGDGVKNVYVQYQDRANLTVTAYRTITLDMTNPVANAGQNQTVIVGTNIAFNGSGSTDNMGIASFLWDFGDGTTGTGVAPTHAYSSVGTFTVKLMVKDLGGNSAANSSTVSVEVVIPEFQPSLIFAAFMLIATALAVALRRRNKPPFSNL